MHIIYLTIDMVVFVLMVGLLAIANKPFTLKPIRAGKSLQPERRKSYR